MLRSSRLNWSPARDRWILRELSTNRRGKRSKTCENTRNPSPKQEVLVVCRVASLRAALTSLANPAESSTGLESTSGYICMMILVTKTESRSRQISLRQRHVCLYTSGVRSIALARSSQVRMNLPRSNGHQNLPNQSNYVRTSLLVLVS